MRHLTGTPALSGNITWQYVGDHPGNPEEGVCVQFHFSPFSKRVQRRDALSSARNAVLRNNINWISIESSDWSFDLDGLRREVPALKDLEWLTGKILVRPELEHDEPHEFGSSIIYTSNLKFHITPEQISAMAINLPSHPPEITASLDRFRRDHPDPSKVGFIMTRFGDTVAHNKITAAVRTGLASHGINALRADDKEYHDDLFPNVLTYIYGCSFGVAVFERLEVDDFNPNVSLEVGYMLALSKPVCLLKDKTLRTLQTDLVGKLYKSFDPQDPDVSIPPELQKWLMDKGIIP